MCGKLRKIYPIDVSTVSTYLDNTFKGCTSLVELRLFKLAGSISLVDSAYISKSSILYVINNSQPKSAITITLHHDAYTRFADDADVLAALTAKNEALAAQGGKLSLVCATHSNEVIPNA